MWFNFVVPIFVIEFASLMVSLAVRIISSIVIHLAAILLYIDSWNARVCNFFHWVAVHVYIHACTSMEVVILCAT